MKMFEKFKIWLNKESEEIEHSIYYYRRTFFGFVLMMVTTIIWWSLVESGLLKVLVSPLAIFQPFTQEYILDTAWEIPFALLVFFLIFLLLLGSLGPGVYFLLTARKRIDMKWVNDPERTERWREKKSPK